MSRKRNRNRSVKVAKATSEQLNVSRMRMSEQGTFALAKVQVDSERMKAEEIRWPNLIGTVESMKQDATVATGLDMLYTFVEKAFKDFKVIPGESEESKKAAKFIEYCLKNMEGQTLRQFARDAATFNEYGLSVVEKVYTQIAVGEYVGKYKVKNLAFRPQASLSRTNPIVYNSDGSAIVGIKQSLSAFQNYTASEIGVGGVSTRMSDVIIPISRVMLMNTGGSSSQALGVSPLVGCYRAWREKILIENLEVVGATKDMGGVIELKIPSQILNKAAMDPSSPEADMVRGLMSDAANAHSGEQSFFMLPSDTKDNAPQYSMTLKGIDGMGKQYSTAQLISDRKKSILDRLGAGFINVGNDKGGSYNLSESKQTIHTQFVQRVNEIILEALNENLLPQLLALNDIRLPETEMPYVKAGEIVDVDMEGFSKAIQRIGAVGYLPKTPKVINRVLEVLGIDEKIEEDISQEELMKLLGEDTSRAGDGMTKGSSGNGTGKISASRDNSAANLDN
ncbi:portal protein [Pectobacterium phage PcCB7V]|nr:portal protein [Pectobacterium phage PcCB7V]